MEIGSDSQLNRKQESILNVNFIVFFLAVFLVFFSLDLFIPILPLYLKELGGDRQAVGLLFAISIMTSIVFRPFWGKLADWKNRKILMLLGTGLCIIAFFGIILSPSISGLFFFRGLQGLGTGSFFVGFQTLIIDIAPRSRRGEAIGLLSIAPALSIGTAPLFAEILRKTGALFPKIMISAAVIAIIAFFITLGINEPERKWKKSINLYDSPRGFCTFGKVWLPSVMIFFVTFTFGGILTFLPLFIEETGISSVGVFLTVFAVINVIFRPLTGRFIDSWGKARFFIPGLILLSASLLLIAFAGNNICLLAGAVMYGLGFSSTSVSLFSLAADSFAPEERGLGIATYSAFFDIGLAIGAILLGFVVARTSFTVMYVFCAIIVLIPLVLFFLKGRYSGDPMPKS